MKIKIAFYRGKGNCINGIVRWWTKSVYSHAELVLPDGVSWLGISPFLKSKVASRKKLIIDPSEWDFIALDVTQEQVDIIMEFFDDTEGHGYDWIGMLLSQFLPCKIKHKKRWYCSEWIAYALRTAGIINWRVIKIYDQCDLSPKKLHEIITTQKKEQQECLLENL